MTMSAEIFRWAMGFRMTKKNAPLRWPPPVNATTWSTAGSAFTTATKAPNFSLIAWNEFLIPLVLADRQAKTLPVYVGGFVTSRVVNWGGMAAAASIAIIPIALLTTVVQRNLVRGLSSGAIKD